MLEVEDVKRLVGPFDPDTLSYAWMHPDPDVDRLHADVTAIVGGRLAADRQLVFGDISTLAHARAGVPRSVRSAPRTDARVPYLNEPWYCCAEPNPEQLRIV
jgi:hypothetical protein